jgi:hypothetical protein
VLDEGLVYISVNIMWNYQVYLCNRYVNVLSRMSHKILHHCNIQTRLTNKNSSLALPHIILTLFELLFSVLRTDQNMSSRTGHLFLSEQYNKCRQVEQIAKLCGLAIDC